jgi:hypothetical protein
MKSPSWTMESIILVVEQNGEQKQAGKFPAVKGIIQMSLN